MLMAACEKAVPSSLLSWKYFPPHSRFWAFVCRLLAGKSEKEAPKHFFKVSGEQ